MTPACHYCPKPAVVFCDHFEGKGGLSVVKDGKALQTCDRPICNEHRRKVGHVCYRGKNKKLSDTIDHCKVHA